MADDMEALARRAMACKGWRWVRGMVAIDGLIVVAVTERGVAFLDDGLRCFESRAVNQHIAWHVELFEYLPDFTNPATLGCLEGLVAEAWNAPLMYVEPCGGGFEARRFEVCNLLGRVADGFPVEAFVNVSGPTKVAALVLALEAAP